MKGRRFWNEGPEIEKEREIRRKRIAGFTEIEDRHAKGKSKDPTKVRPTP